MSGHDCATCGARHDELPAGYLLAFPSEAFAPGSLRIEREGEMVAAGVDRFVLANVELAVRESAGDLFVLTCWFSVTETSYARYESTFETEGRESDEPFFAWLASDVPTYEPPRTNAIRARLHQRPVGERPVAELEPTAHPLAREAATGVSRDRIAAIYHAFIVPS